MAAERGRETDTEAHCRFVLNVALPQWKICRLTFTILQEGVLALGSHARAGRWTAGLIKTRDTS